MCGMKESMHEKENKSFQIERSREVIRIDLDFQAKLMFCFFKFPDSF